MIASIPEKRLHLSDQEFYVSIKRTGITWATLMRESFFEEIHEFDLSKTDEEILKEAEAIYILKNLHLDHIDK